MKAIITTVILLISLQLIAQDEFIIKDVKLFDGSDIIKKTSVRVKNGKIAEVSPELNLKESIKTIDGTGKTLIPAMSNAHVHAWSAASLKQAAKAGVLNVMDMHGIENFQYNLRKLKDSTNYARYYVAGFAATAPEGHGTQFGFAVPTLTKPEEAQEFVAERVKSNVDYIKIIVEPYRETLSPETVKALVKEAHKANLKAVVHVSRLEDAVQVLENNADALVHIWWDKPIASEKLSELSENKDFFIIPTLLTTLKAFEAMGDESRNFLTKAQLLAEIKKLHDAGIPILAGTDPPNLNINYGTDLYEELFLLKEAGLTELEILKTASSNVAKAFDLENLGKIQSGFIADMLLINGDPTENIQDIKNIEFIWKAGQRINTSD
jgi:imidazolonepropionase-like amidohydrolase